MSKKEALPNNESAPDKGQDPLWGELKRRYELILQSAGVGIYGLDTKGHTTFANRAAAEMIGWELGELVGKSQHDILHHTKADGTAYPKEECPI